MFSKNTRPDYVPERLRPPLQRSEEKSQSEKTFDTGMRCGADVLVHNMFQKI